MAVVVHAVVVRCKRPIVGVVLLAPMPAWVSNTPIARIWAVRVTHRWSMALVPIVANGRMRWSFQYSLSATQMPWQRIPLSAVRLQWGQSTGEEGSVGCCAAAGVAVGWELEG